MNSSMSYLAKTPMLTFDSANNEINIMWYRHNQKKIKPFKSSPFIFNEKYDEDFWWMLGYLQVCDDFAINWIKYKFFLYLKITNYHERKRQC